MNYQNIQQPMPMMNNMQQQQMPMGYPQQQMPMGYPQQYYPQQQMGYPQQHSGKSWYQTFWGKRIAAVIVIAILAVLLYYYGCELPIIGWFCSIFSTIRKFLGGILSAVNL
jgi:hypothetical protein